MVYSQYKLDSVVGGEAQGQQKRNNINGVFKQTKINQNESDSENEAANFFRFVAMVSLEEVYLAKFSPFFIAKVISTRAASKNLRKIRNGNLLVKVDTWRQAENIV